jgi:SAM-dependent methyltransferase
MRRALVDDARRREPAPLEQRRPSRARVRERLAPPFERFLEDAVGSAQRVLDVGCGENSPVGRFKRRPQYSLGIDLFPRALARAAEAGTHSEHRLMDVMEIGEAFEPNSFDACVAFDLLEHLPKKKGTILLELMERVAGHRVVVFTPHGFLAQEATEMGMLFTFAWRARFSVDRVVLFLLVFGFVCGLTDRQIDLRNLSPEYVYFWYPAAILLGRSVKSYS